MKKLTFKEIITVASMLFGMFFGAGNLIFPASMGQLAGRNMWMAAAGFLITGVGLPLLGVAALGISRRDGLFELASRVGRPFLPALGCGILRPVFCHRQSGTGRHHCLVASGADVPLSRGHRTDSADPGRQIFRQ